MKKVILWFFGIVFGLFASTFTVYFFNLDMKLLSKIEPLFIKHYDNMPRNKYI